LLEESVKLRLVSDVPLGAFLSGGLDSSAVVATMARLTSQPVQTFSIGFAESDFNELRYARMVAERFRTDHHELVLEPSVVDIVEDIAWYLDEPFGDSSAIPTYLVSQMASEHVTVVLSGDGGDELFAGYDKYLIEGREREALGGGARAALRALGRLMPDGMKGHNFVNHHGLTAAARYLDGSTLFRERQKRRLFLPDAYARLGHGAPWLQEALALLPGRGHWLSELQLLDLERSLPLDILTKVDRMSMAASLEVRVPLLDRRIVDFARRLPLSLKIRGNTGKHLLREAGRSLLPAAVYSHPKRGFSLPLHGWFNAEFWTLLDDLYAPGSEAARLFRAGAVERTIAEGRAAAARTGVVSETTAATRVWLLAGIARWMERFGVAA
jgi:asparagine synthase (glutamine-hydrolysing)